MASIGIGFLGEPSLAKLLEPVFGGLSHGAAVALSVVIAFTLVTAIHISIGEQVPKMLAISHAERTARRVSRPLNWFRAVTAPVMFALSGLSNAIVRLFGVNPGDLEEHHTAEDLKQIIDSSKLGGTLDPGEAGMLGGVFHLHEQEAREVMTPIPAVVTVDFSESVEAALRALRHLRPHAAGRDRGRKPRPGEGDRPQQQPRPALHERGSRGLDRAGRSATR